MFRIILFFGVLVLFPLLARAEESPLAEMKRQLESLQRQVQEQNRQIEVLTKRVEEAEKGKGSTPSPEADQTQNVGQIGPFKYQRTPGKASAFLPDISVIGVFAGAYFTDEPGERGHNPERTGFNLQEIELAIQSVIDPYVRGDIFFSFHEDGVELEEGYVTTLSLPANLQIRAGKMLLPFGRLNQKHLEKWNFVNNSLVNDKILGPEGFNELAFVPSVLFPTPFFLQLEGGFSQGDNEDNFDGGRKEDFAYSGRLSASVDVGPDVTLLAGTSGAFGFNDTAAGNTTAVVGGDFLLKWRPSAVTGIDWQTEYIHRWRETPGDLEKEGGIYTELVGQWTKRWQAGTRFDFLGLPRQDERKWRLSPMIKFMPSDFFALRVQYDLEESDLADVSHAAFLQMIFNMGPHGAHAF